MERSKCNFAAAAWRYVAPLGRLILQATGHGAGTDPRPP
jgi:hypothetical protein